VDISVRVKSRAQVSSRLAPPHGAAHSKGILVNAVDKEQLLVRWLQEVIFQMNVKQAVPTGFKIISLAEGTLEAQISYVPFDARIHEFRREVKAATYHGLSMKKSGGQFRAAVIFDI
jgi:SHS2 domain-containing protein